MNTQTFAHTQAFTAINDDELIVVNGGGVSWEGKIVGGGNVYLGDQRYTPGVPPNLTFLMQAA